MKKNFLWLLLSGLPFVSFGQAWIHAKTQDGITVYTRISDDSPVKEFKAIGLLQASPEEIVSVLLDFEDYSAWYDHCKKARLLAHHSDTSMTYYLELAMPFPFSNRDAVLDMTIDRQREHTTLRYDRNTYAMEEVDGVVRMPVSQGLWILTAKGDETEVVHQFRGDPAGQVPASIANLFVVAGPIQTLTALQQFLSE
ncbi:START domain-containing protein [Reichenbachiella sp. MSK19-1]|uniref:START domain-containing protein n=1 Tax=Reichenbachiella sp. MSK19-1 TaxID=1897631 RepID=UPI000E6B911D|nr:START domain-containing protein [Reichenbachiella sp. MSK19-1]RJE74119.1 hypothetical protein BGP76_13055 [Reichenbachiella sp. MSK19-1]